MNVSLKSLTPSNRRPIYTLDVHPDGRQLALGQQSDDEGNPYLGLWSLDDLQPASAVESGGYGLALMARFAPDGRTLAYVNSDLVVRFYDLARQEKRVPQLDNPNVKWLSYAQGTGRLALAGALTQVWDESRQGVIWTLPGQTAVPDRAHVPAVAGLSADGTRVAVAGAEADKILIFDVERGSREQELEGAPRQARWVSFDPSGRYLAAIEWLSHGTLLWDVRSGEQLLPRIFHSRRESFWSLCFHPDGEHLALGMLSGYVLVVRLADGEYVVDQRAHAGRVWDLAFTPDGKHMISGGDDAVAHVWELS
jgi:WD40 repeat protein